MAAWDLAHSKIAWQRGASNAPPLRVGRHGNGLQFSDVKGHGGRGVGDDLVVFHRYKEELALLVCTERPVRRRWRGAVKREDSFVIVFCG